jgi:F-type H+-transporting ATPase subunit a
MIVFNGLRYNGIAYIAHFFQGPIYISPLIAVLEMIGLLAKTFALAVRLFANMVAGHILLAVLISFIGMAFVSGPAMGFMVAIPVVLAGVAFNLLELFVAFLQAFIFTFLTAVFVGQAVVIHHDEHHAESTHAEATT